MLLTITISFLRRAYADEGLAFSRLGPAQRFRKELNYVAFLTQPETAKGFGIGPTLIEEAIQ